MLMRPLLPTMELGAVADLLKKHGAMLEEVCGSTGHL